MWKKNEHLHRVAARPRALGLQAAGGQGLQHAADHLQGRKSDRKRTFSPAASPDFCVWLKDVSL